MGLVFLYFSLSFGYGLLSGAHAIVHELSLHVHGHTHPETEHHVIHDHVNVTKELAPHEASTSDFSTLVIILPVFFHAGKQKDNPKPPFHHLTLTQYFIHYAGLKTSPPNPPPPSI